MAEIPLCLSLLMLGNVLQLQDIFCNILDLFRRFSPLRHATTSTPCGICRRTSSVMMRFTKLEVSSQIRQGQIGL